MTAEHGPAGSLTTAHRYVPAFLALNKQLTVIPTETLHTSPAATAEQRRTARRPSRTGSCPASSSPAPVLGSGLSKCIDVRVVQLSVQKLQAANETSASSAWKLTLTDVSL